MRKNQILGAMALLGALLMAGGPAWAEEASIEERLKRLEEKLGGGEQPAGKEGQDVPLAAPEGPHRRSRGWTLSDSTSIGAYGEFIYNNKLGDSQKDQLDARRVVLFLAHEFSDEWHFFTEIEFEHAGEEVGIEQGFIDYLPMEELGVQAGVLLVPVGIVNLAHEPTTFYFAERPRVDRVLVPTTWRELGVLAHGTIGSLSYQAGVLGSGMIPTDSALGDELSAFSTDGIRGIRQNAIEAKANDFAVVGRLEFRPVNELTLATSGYSGEIDQNDATAARDARITLWETDARIQWEELDIRGQYVLVWIGDAAALNALGSTDAVPERMHGGYVEAAYNFLPLIASDTKQKLFIAFRGEWLDLQNKIASNGVKDPAGRQDEYNIGLAWKPIEQVIVKADYQIRKSDAGPVTNQANASVGFSF